jgi:hypothetical protein
MTSELIHRLHFAFIIPFHISFLSSPRAWGC